MTPSTPRTKKTSGIALHASTVALTPARAATSHLRKRYRDLYRGKYRFAPLVFAFDMFLVGVLLGLLVLNVFWLLQASFIKGAGLELSLSAEPLRAADIMPVLARIHPTDGREHDDVILYWHLPEWVEVVQAEPPIRSDGSIRLGRILGSQERESRLLVRIRAPQGTSVPFAFTLQQFDPLGLNRLLTGVENRPIVSSAVQTNTLLPFTSYAHGASLPIFVSNTGSSTIPAVSVHVEDVSARNIDGQQDIALGALGPGESRILLFDAATASSTTFAWTVRDEAQIVATQQVVLPETQAPVPVAVASPLISDAAADHVSIFYKSQSLDGKLLIIHPLLAGAQPYLLAPATAPSKDSIDVPLRIGAASSTKWNVITLLQNGSDVILGPAMEGTIRHTFPFRSEARYFTTTGDQLGVGPTPPKTGEQTSYWIVWTIGPADDEYSDLTLATDLPDGVHATGKFASSAGGAFEARDQHVQWTIPSLELTGADAQTFAFEVNVTPDKDQKGKVLPLVGTSTAHAVDTITGIELQADASGDDSRLLNDGRAKGNGIVR